MTIQENGELTFSGFKDWGTENTVQRDPFHLCDETIIPAKYILFYSKIGVPLHSSEKFVPRSTGYENYG